MRLNNLEAELLYVDKLIQDEEKNFDRLSSLLIDKSNQLAIDLEAYTLAVNCLKESDELLKRISTVVSQFLPQLFETGTSFTLEFNYNKLGDLKGIRPVITHKGYVSDGMTNRSGDGVKAAVGLLLYLVIICLNNKVPRICFLDEPTPQVHAKVWQKLGEVLEALCKTYNLQLFITTQMGASIGNVYECHNGVVTLK